MMQNRGFFSTAYDCACLARTRYLALTVPPFVVGVLADPGNDSRYLWIGVLTIVILRGISSIGNCIADRVEDAIDHPERAVLCEYVGYSTLRGIVLVLLIAYLALLLTMTFVLNVYWGAIALWIAYLLVKLSYSFGPRLKPKRSSATIILGAVSGGMFFVGWIGNGLHDVATGIVVAILLWSMGASLSGSKDAADLEGDARIGYRSVYKELMDSSHPLWRSIRVTSRPYLVAAAGAIVTTFIDGPDISLFWCLALYPLAISFAVFLVRARSVAERSFLREFGYLYWIVFMGVVLISVMPTLTVVIVAVGALIWYLVISWLAHPDPVPYHLRDLREVRNAIVRA
jgi:4-hydroxybenzoate polyprenyltransferase